MGEAGEGRLWRVTVRSRSAEYSPQVGGTLRRLHRYGFREVERVDFARVFLLAGVEDRASAERVGAELLADPVIEEASVAEVAPSRSEAPDGGVVVEVHFHPGVMDPVAESTVSAVRDLGISCTGVRTARQYTLYGRLEQERVALLVRRCLANECIERAYVWGREWGEVPPLAWPRPISQPFELRRVGIRECSDEDLVRLSREGHLFLSLEEMRAIREHFRGLGRDPTDLELETLAQTWSEHCVHKTLRSEVVYRGDPLPAPPGAGERGRVVEGGLVEVRYGNLLRETIMRATEEVGRAWCLSVFRDNAGVMEFDEEYGIAVKVETHNHPSAIEPYGGAATGVGGCVRDILGVGLGAKPVACTDVFCVGPLDWPWEDLPGGVLHPQTILEGVVAGVRDYGNRLGIPTVAGAIHFHPGYLANPLVFVGCVGLIPKKFVTKNPAPGDRIVVLGGRTGRDGIHGATFSSAELTQRHADEFAHAVQIGNAITQKKMLDVLLAAREEEGGCLFSAVTDCGAGGLSSAVGEMAAGLGAVVDLDRVPLKYEGLRYDEIWISESQERMVLAVPPSCVDRLAALCEAEGVEYAVIGEFTGEGRLVCRYRGEVVGDLDVGFLHEGRPEVVREAVWSRPASDEAERDAERTAGEGDGVDFLGELRRQLGRGDVASKQVVIRQYDHEVQGGAVIRALVGPEEGPSDAAVIRPRLDSHRGVAIGCGLCPQESEDPYWMAVAAVDEALRNVISVGGDPERTALLDNFCWGRTDEAASLGGLVRACQGAADAAVALGLPFISGKDSLNNEFALGSEDVERVASALAARGYPREAERVRERKRLAIPGTLLITAVSVIEDVGQCVTMDLKQGGNLLVMIGERGLAWYDRDRPLERYDLSRAAVVHRTVAELIRRGLVVSAHDVSDGGALTACAEMALAGGLGLEFHSWLFHHGRPETLHRLAFGEAPGRYVVEVEPDTWHRVVRPKLLRTRVSYVPLATVIQPRRIIFPGLVELEPLGRRWREAVAAGM